MSVEQMDFQDYNLVSIADNPRGVYALADGLLPAIAEAVEVHLDEHPNNDDLVELTQSIGRFKELQKNIGDVKELLAKESNSLRTAVDWTTRAGVLGPLDRNFITDESAPWDIDGAVITGGVARWMLRRKTLLLDSQIRATGTHKIGKVHLMTGQRVMGLGEHKSVGDLAKKLGRAPTESEFAAEYLEKRFDHLGVNVTHTKVGSENGDEIFAEGIASNESILDGTIAVVGNAPSAVMTTGQFFLQALGHNPVFNYNHDQLFMIGDGYPLASTAEQATDPANFQNPYTALGAIARNGLILHRVAQGLKNT